MLRHQEPIKSDLLACTKKASQQDRFPRIGHIVTSSQFQNRERTLKLNGYRILTMQNSTGKLMGWIVARKLAHGLERRNVLPPNQGGYRAGKPTWENPARFAYNVYEGFQGKELTLAMAVDLEDADNTYNRVQFKLLMELLVQYSVNLALTRWLAAASQERKVAMRLGNWISRPQELTMGLPQGFP